MYKLLNHIMRYYDPDHEVPTIQEGEPTPVMVRGSKYSAQLRKDMDQLIGTYTMMYTKHISPKIPYINKAIVYRTMAEPMRHYGLQRMVELLDVYLGTDDKYFRSEKWGILTFLSQRTLNKLEQ